jgi:hypothetical protein
MWLTGSCVGPGPMHRLSHYSTILCSGHGPVQAGHAVRFAVSVLLVLRVDGSRVSERVLIVKKTLKADHSQCQGFRVTVSF